MKKLIAMITMLMLLSLMAGCKSTDIKVEGEDGPCDIYTYPKDNMFGLEKIVLFEDHAVAVFDAKTCDEGYVPLKELYEKKETRFVLLLDNVSKSKIEDGSLIKLNDKYVLTAAESYDEADIVDKSISVKAKGLNFGNGKIVCDDDKTHLEYMLVDSEYTDIATQDYSVDTGKWGEIVSNGYAEQPASDIVE